MNFCYLTTTGRVSGRPHEIEIWFGRDGDTLYLLAGGRDRSDWVRNLMADPDVTVRLDSVHRGRARVLEEGTDEDALARRLLLEKYEKHNELQQWGRASLAVAVDIDPVGG